MANFSALPSVSVPPRDLNPGSSQFHPGGQQRFNSSATPAARPGASPDSLISDLLARVGKLEHGQGILSGQVGRLGTDYAALSRALTGLKNGVQPPNTRIGLREGNVSYPQGLDGPADIDGSEHSEKPGKDSASLPPHLRSASGSSNGTASLPPYLRTKAADVSVATDKKADYAALFDEESTPRADSPTTVLNPDTPCQSVEKPHPTRSPQDWTPIALTHFPKVDPVQLASVPSPTEIVTFSQDFLTNTFGGSFWTPGLKYIAPPAVCMLPTRSYWLMDASVEPYLPQAPAQHGAKLTAFFNNEDPTELFDEGTAGSFDNVPMFVCNTPWAVDNARRYVYMGHYSQTRWSDKLDYDRMVEHVPAAVKTYWAEELSAAGRAEWVTEALKKHFFPMPQYEGRLPRGHVNGSVAPDDEAKEEEKVLKELKDYLAELKEWNEEAELKTRLIKKDFILQAFERADVDIPPGLRLQLEYLQCTQYDRSFYDMLVQLQSRNANYLK